MWVTFSWVDNCKTIFIKRSTTGNYVDFFKLFIHAANIL